MSTHFSSRATFSPKQATIEDMTQALTHLHKTFDTFFRRGGTILAVTGNHDREGRIEMLRRNAPRRPGRRQPGICIRPHVST